MTSGQALTITAARTGQRAMAFSASGHIRRYPVAGFPAAAGQCHEPAARTHCRTGIGLDLTGGGEQRL